LLERNLLKKIIAYCYKIKNIELATKILFYSLNEIFNNKSTKEEILYDVALYATNELKDYVVSEIIFKELIEEFSAQEDVILMRSYRSLGLIRYSLQNKEYHSEFEKYVFLLRKNRNFDQSLSPDDFNAALYYIVYLREQENILGALEICKLFVSFENKIGNKPPLDFLLIYFLYAQTSHLLNLREEALSYAKKTLALIDSNKLSKDMPIDHQGINTIHRELNKIVKHYSISQFIEDPFRKIGRNKLIKVRYVDGSVKEEKFKKLENDLRLNNCTLIEG
jgi:tetratricopeptide (TPR) repeat protein